MNDHDDAYEEVGEAIRVSAATVRAPDRLQARVAAQRSSSAPPRALPLRVAALTAVAAALALAFVLAAGSGPSVQDVAAAALNVPTRPAPAPDPREAGTIRARIEGLPFPNLEEPWGWRAVGARTDEVAGRRALTVIYRKGDQGVHYTIVAGGPLAAPEGARREKLRGRTYTILRDRGAQVVTWEREGHTCVLASRAVDAAGLLRFASWS